MSNGRKALIISLILHALLIYLFMTARFEIKDFTIRKIIDVVPIKPVAPMPKIFVPPNAQVPNPQKPLPQIQAQPQPQSQNAQPSQPQGRVPIVVKKFEMISPPPGKPDGDKSIKPLPGQRSQEPLPDQKQDVPETKTTKTPPKNTPSKNTKTDAASRPTIGPSPNITGSSRRLTLPELSPLSPSMNKLLGKANKNPGSESGDENRLLDAIPDISTYTKLPFTDQNNGFGAGGDGISAYGGGAYFNSKGFDVTPWAKRVVYSIKSNWIIPIACEAGIKGTVGIYVVFGRNGRILKLELRQSSKLGSYDQASLNAFKLSNPFPALPDNFPNPDLDAYFVFQYN
ncbi:MAG: TonB C-terminal domain-containing protein [Candidatus Omnitrophota bacterium]